jgi:hypothetical protein
LGNIVVQDGQVDMPEPGTEPVPPQPVEDPGTNGDSPPQILTFNGGEMSESGKEVLKLAQDTLGMLKNKDWGAVGRMTHPEQGLTFSPYGFVDTSTAVCFGMGDVATLEDDGMVRVWGHYDGSGEPIECEFGEYYDRFVMSHDFTRATQIGVERIVKDSGHEMNLYVFGNGASYVDFQMPGSGSEADYNWASLQLVFSWFGGDQYHVEGLYLVAVVHDTWSP